MASVTVGVGRTVSIKCLRITTVAFKYLWSVDVWNFLWGGDEECEILQIAQIDFVIAVYGNLLSVLENGKFTVI